VGALVERARRLEAELTATGLVWPGPVSGATTRGVTDQSIRLGAVTALSTPQGTAEPFPGICEGMTARVVAQNATGGVTTAGGVTRVLELVGDRDLLGRSCQDDGSDPARNLALVTRAVEEQQVFALLPTTSLGFQSDDYLTDQHVPYVGNGFQPGYCGADRPFGFAPGGPTTCASGTFTASDVVARSYLQASQREAAATTLAVIADDTVAGAAALEEITAGAERTGVAVSYAEASYPMGTATLADLAELGPAVMAADPTAIVLATSRASTLALATTLRGMGYRGDLIEMVGSDERMFVVFDTYRALDGALTVTSGIGPTRQSGGAYQTIAAQLAAAGFTTPITPGVLYGWATADFLIRSLEATPEPLTTEALANTVNGGTFVYGGFANVICPSVWPLQHVVTTACAHVVRVESGAANVLHRLGYPGVRGGFTTVLDTTYFEQFLVDG
jgi:hypothetical protein